MQDRITLRPADSVSSAAFVDAINLAYRDYYRPLYLTPQSFEAMVEREAIKLGASIVALDGVEVVGGALLGIRQPRGWIGGVGVVPGHRRQGIARAMMEHLLAQAAQLALETIQLEVVTLNERARALYESLGFAAQRRLLLLTREPSRPARLPANALPRCQPHPAREILGVLEALDGVTRSWSRDAPALRPIADLFEGYVALGPDSNEPVGACLFSAHPFQVGLVSLAGSQPAATSLLNTLHKGHPEATISYFNVPADDPLVPELLQAGYRETLAQLEMLRSL